MPAALASPDQLEALIRLLLDLLVVLSAGAFLGGIIALVVTGLRALAVHPKPQVKT